MLFMSLQTQMLNIKNVHESWKYNILHVVVDLTQIS